MHFKDGMFSRMGTSGPEHSVDNLHGNGARIPDKHATASVRRRRVPPERFGRFRSSKHISGYSDTLGKAALQSS